jgi:tetratricopeptide (TPR) repeat protein
MNHAIELANGISDEELKVSVLLAIAFEQENLGLINEAKALIQEALSCAYGIGDESTKINVLKEISLVLTKKDKWELAQETGLKITQIAQRHACWKNIASEMLEENGWEKALYYYKKLHHEEARSFYLNGWAKNVMVTDVNEKCFRQSLPLLARDSEALEMLIQKYAVREVMLSSPSQELVKRLSGTLNLQWAIDIKNQLPN